MTVQEKLTALLAAANNITGESDTDLTGAIQSLVDGYGGGALPEAFFNLKPVIDVVEATLVSDVTEDVVLSHNLGVDPILALVSIKNISDYASSTYAETRLGAWIIRTQPLFDYYRSHFTMGGGSSRTLGSSLYKRVGQSSINEETGSLTNYITDFTSTTVKLPGGASYLYRAGMRVQILLIGVKADE